MSEFSDIPEEDLDDLLDELEDLTQPDPAFYTPHPKQLKFHQAVKPVRCMFGGNRSGKTEAGTLECYFHASGDYPEWYPKERRFAGPTRGRIVVTDYKVGANEVLEPKIRSWFPHNRIIKIEKYMGHISKVYIRHVTGGVSTFDILTHEQKNDVFEGWNGHWVWFDEPPPREKYIASRRGLIDLGGFCWITATPITEPWMHQEVIKGDPDIFWYITVDMRDNPYISESEIKLFEASLTPEEKEARLHGKFRHLAGLVYKSLDPDVHVKPLKELGVRPEWPTYFVLDPADRRPHHGIWAKVDPFGVIYIVDEIVYKGTVKETIKEVFLRERMNKINPMQVIRLLDPNKGQAPGEMGGLSLIKMFSLGGMHFTTKINDNVTAGHLAVQERLHYDKEKKVELSNRPKIYWAEETTKECINQLLSYVWDDWKGSLQSQRTQKEKVKDINKDMPDCVRYLCIFDPQFYSQADESDPISYNSSSVTGYVN